MKVSTNNIVYRSFLFNQWEKSSWHRKLVIINFCPFFWTYLIIMVRNTFLSFMVGLVFVTPILMTLINYVAMIFGYGISAGLDVDNYGFIAGGNLWLIGLVGAAFIVSCVAGGYWLVDKITEIKNVRAYDKAVNNILKHKEPNLLWEWLKAKKDKFCPVLEWTDPTDKVKCDGYPDQPIEDDDNENDLTVNDIHKDFEADIDDKDDYVTADDADGNTYVYNSAAVGMTYNLDDYHYVLDNGMLHVFAKDYAPSLIVTTLKDNV